ncbi:hypothetical protein NSU_2815 [Novosphingobium pentaromativorans US6-1]|uniref:Uncharacterized protein n=1 Tax=Novosphingobium pentaromativorans US6-1 TaxID=1088721 RepID=G6EEP3_9SPHN|nr:hypothetical protein NSU_2815 [Novosphingobium pentaromativorans US6-1]
MRIDRARPHQEPLGRIDFAKQQGIEFRQPVQLRFSIEFAVRRHRRRAASRCI